jgi:hypothetical protein
LITTDGPVTVVAGTDGAVVKGLPPAPCDLPRAVAGAFPFTAVEQRGGRVVLRDGSPAGIDRFVAGFARRGVPATVRHTFGPVCAGGPAPVRRSARHMF